MSPGKALVPDDLQKALTKMVEARDELKEATAQAHAARRDLLHTVKAETDALREIIHEAVTDAVDRLAESAGTEMRSKVADVIARLEADWRAKLGL